MNRRSYLRTAAAGEVHERIRRLVDAGVLSRFGPLFDAGAIGGTTTLAAMSVPEGRFEAVAEAVNGYREVAHNYERDHRLNMWFVLSVADPDRVPEVLASIERETGLEVYDLPKRREFRLEARFPVRDGLDLSRLGPDPGPSDRDPLRPRERDLIVERQDGLPLTRTPYADAAEAVGATPGSTIRTIKRFLAEGKVRRVVHERCGPVDREVLYSTRVLKKSGLRLPRRAAWNTEPIR